MYRVKKQSIYKYAIKACVLSMLSLLVFIDKDGGDKTKVPKIANTDIIEPGTN